MTAKLSLSPGGQVRYLAPSVGVQLEIGADCRPVLYVRGTGVCAWRRRTPRHVVQTSKHELIF